MTLWSVSPSIIVVCIYEDGHAVFLVSQIIYKVLQIHQCLLVRVDIADACRLVFVLYVVLMFPRSGITRLCLVANPVYCYIR
jgi:hypothetical protein